MYTKVNYCVYNKLVVYEQYKIPVCFNLTVIFATGGTEQVIVRWMVSTESQIVFVETQPMFVTGLAAVFATFYVFNLQY